MVFHVDFISKNKDFFAKTVILALLLRLVSLKKVALFHIL